MPIDVTLIVTDTSPLITLAAVQSLDYLLYPALPVVIPDAVFYEATNASGKLGAQEIIDWYRANTDKVRIEPTEIFRDALILAPTKGGRLSRDTGERAAIEVVRYFPLKDTERAILLTDDRDVERFLVIDAQKLILLTTWDYLNQLEDAQRIRSAGAIMDLVYKIGRNPPKTGLWEQHDLEIRDAVRSMLERAHKNFTPKQQT